MRTNMGKHLFLAVVALALCCRCGQAGGQGLPCANTVTADVVAMDQVITYNRYGAVDPDGMIFALMRDVVAEGAGGIAPGNVRLRDGKRPRPLVLRVNQGDCLEVTLTNLLDPTPGLPIATRTVSMHVNGLDYASIDDDASYIGENPSAVQSPGTSTTYTWYAAHQGQFMLHSTTNDAGGEGDSGSQAHGLFGCVNVEPPGSSWYRSQETADRLATTIVGANPNGTPILDYEAIGADGMPILNMLSPAGELIYSDLNAIITGFTEDCTNTPPSGICGKPFREFTVIFHDEIAIQQAFPILKDDVIYHGVRDGFAINYGSGALGAMLVANRLGIGPAADCGECKFEEFFLTSWTQGDPAMPVETDPVTGVAVGVPFPDDPSNVHHSYLGDPVIFRNLHVGKESHVFHLHGHQWLFTPRDENSVYLDSQSISPGSAYTYEINYGGSGNRNLAAGDHIFHCHLYPHFAQGMWELWRAHDVFEMGTPDRSLPDGEILAGTPTPAVVPIPGMGLPPMPTPDFLGYPFYIEANVGHRPPQPPMDLTRDGGLPRHQMLSTTVIDGTAAIDPHYQTDPIYQRVAASNANPGTLGWARKVISAEMELLPDAGTPAEQAAMAFHEGTHGTGAVPVTTDYGWPAVGYPTYDSSGNPGHFLVNGLPPKPGAPYADPCPPTFVDGNGLERPTPERFYDAAFVQFDMTVNALGHHDRQARIIVLREDVFPTLDGTRPPEPLFFRANSGDCVLFQATNLHPNNLNVDDFQVFTPTDTVGQHIHLVKFDVTSSDGSANGWNYEDGTFSAEEVRERIEANNAYQASIGGTQILE
ncbi:MAG: multicopper oxidase domain-containing protein, partial [Planctomycetota bacterium]